MLSRLHLFPYFVFSGPVFLVESLCVLSTGVRLDLLHVPLRDGVAGGVLCIAALHHLATEARRIEAIAGE